MYTPPHFKEDRLDVLQEMLDSARLATLVTLGKDGLLASHIPVMLDRALGPNGTLFGHLSRANSQGQESDPAVPALAIFTGPDAYISPSWYATKAQTHKVVPTWNYQALHAYGEIEFFDDAPALLALVSGLTDKHEAGRATPWAVSDAPADYIDAQLKGIVGFKLHISRLDGVSKLSQNKTLEDRRGVIEGLKKDGAAPERIIADLMSDK